MRADEFRRMQARAMSEKQLQDLVVALARQLGWLVYHTYDSRRSEPGYPDLHLVHSSSRRSLFRELKSESGIVSTPQRNWIAALQSCGCDVGVWRPADWMAGTIEKELRHVRR